MSDINVLALVGSLRAASVNHQIAALSAETAPAGITVTVYHGLGAASANFPSTTRTSTTPPTYPPRLAPCATPSPTPTRSWW